MKIWWFLLVFFSVLGIFGFWQSVVCMVMPDKKKKKEELVSTLVFLHQLMEVSYLWGGR